MLSPDIRNKSAMSILMIPIQHCTGSSTQYSKAKRETKGIQNGKEEVKPFLFSDDIIICVGIIWHHRLNEHEFEQTLRDSEGKGSLTCCIPRSCKESDKTQQLNNNCLPPGLLGTIQEGSGQVGEFSMQLSSFSSPSLWGFLNVILLNFSSMAQSRSNVF